MNVWLARAACLGLVLSVSVQNAAWAQAADNTPAVLSISPTSLDFGSQPVNLASAPQSVTVANRGQTAVEIEVLVSGIDFSQTNDCGSTLAAGASCTVQVVFRPAISGPRVGTLNITDPNPATPHIVVLSGTGS